MAIKNGKNVSLIEAESMDKKDIFVSVNKFIFSFPKKILSHSTHKIKARGNK
jgi:hypothetical protein